MNYREKMETEARAKIFWGDSVESVMTDLQSQGVSPQEAQNIVDVILTDRHAVVRAMGRRKVIAGALLIPVPIATYVTFTIMGYFSVRIFGVTVFVGLYGGWKLVDGMINTFSPNSHTGDLSAESDQ